MPIIVRDMTYRRMDTSLEFIKLRLNALELTDSPEERNGLLRSIHTMVDDIRSGIRVRQPSHTFKDTRFSRSTVYTFAGDPTSPFKITRVRKERDSDVTWSETLECQE